MTPREIHLEKIRNTKIEIERAHEGPHKRDLIKCLRRLKRELKFYDKGHRERVTA